MLVACAGFSVAFLAFTIVEYRYGILQRDRDGRGGLIDAARDPTLDLYGWDQVAREIHSRGLVENPGTFLFTRFWYQSASSPMPWMGSIPSSAITPTTLAVLRSGASPTTGSVMMECSWSLASTRRWPVITGAGSLASSRSRISGSSARESPSGGLAFTAVLASESRIRSPGKVRRGWLATALFNDLQMPGFRAVVRAAAGELAQLAVGLPYCRPLKLRKPGTGLQAGNLFHERSKSPRLEEILNHVSFRFRI